MLFSKAAAVRGTIGDVIMPNATRKRLARALAMLRPEHAEGPSGKHDYLPLLG
jgi:propionyl-CoA carboxylase beta chain